MKYLLTSILVSAICLIAQCSYGQNQLKTTQAEFTIKDKVHEFNIPITEDGLYKISVLSPSGELISTPIQNRNFTKGQEAEFSINSKYWKAGSYSILIEKDQHIQDRLTINISDDKAKKEMMARRKVEAQKKKKKEN